MRSLQDKHFKRVAISVVLALIVLVVLGVAIFTPRSSAPVGRPTDLGTGLVTKKVLPSLAYGIQVFTWWDAAARPRDLEIVRMMRFQYIKQIFGWRDIYPTKNDPPHWQNADEVVAEAAYRGLKIVARLGLPPTWAITSPNRPEDPPFDLTAFATYCSELATRYKGQITAYQVWNEPNLDREWLDHTPNAASYVRVLSACYKALKAADPAAVVISAGLAPTGTLSPQVIPDEQYLREMYQAGASAYYDVLGLNAPGYKSPPETDPASLGDFRWQTFRHVEDMRALMVANGDGAKQVAILEMGWSVDERDSIPDKQGTAIPNPYRWHAVSEQQQADYLVGAYNYAASHWRPWISLMSMIYIPDPAWTKANEEYWWSILETEGDIPRRRQVFFSVANAARYIDEVVVPPILDGVNPYAPLPPRKPNANTKP